MHRKYSCIPNPWWHYPCSLKICIYMHVVIKLLKSNWLILAIIAFVFWMVCETMTNIQNIHENGVYSFIHSESQINEHKWESYSFFITFWSNQILNKFKKKTFERIDHWEIESKQLICNRVRWHNFCTMCVCVYLMSLGIGFLNPFQIIVRLFSVIILDTLYMIWSYAHRTLTHMCTIPASVFVCAFAVALCGI